MYKRFMDSEKEKGKRFGLFCIGIIGSNIANSSWNFGEV